jgi:hypothetical protein
MQLRDDRTCPGTFAGGIFAGAEIEGWLSIAWNRCGRVPEHSTPRRRFSLTPFGIVSSLGRYFGVLSPLLAAAGA